MKLFLRLLSLSCCFSVLLAIATCPLDDLCGSSEVASGFVSNYCDENNGTMVERCCMSGRNHSTLIGLDCRNCNLTKINTTSIPRGDVEIIDLQDNEFKYASEKEFLGFVKLNILYLPLASNCPGGDPAWNFTYKNASENFTECYEQRIPCDYRNVSCSVNGDCVNEGPGSAKCVCKPNHYGYKCLQEGIFPTTVFIISICVPCVLLSIISWFYLRKNVVVPIKEE